MNIDNNTNISSMVSQSLSRLNLNNINRSNKAGGKEEINDRITSSELIEEKIQTSTETNNDKSNSNINIEEIQKYASLMGENLSIEDINYGIRYGRSVIAEYSV